MDRAPYLDKIVTSSHLPRPEGQTGYFSKKTFPDLSHTGVRSKFQPQITLPTGGDGRITRVYKDEAFLTISKYHKELVEVNNREVTFTRSHKQFLDKVMVDMENSRRAKNKKQEQHWRTKKDSLGFTRSFDVGLSGTTTPKKTDPQLQLTKRSTNNGSRENSKTKSKNKSLSTTATGKSSTPAPPLAGNAVPGDSHSESKANLKARVINEDREHNLEAKVEAEAKAGENPPSPAAAQLESMNESSELYKGDDDDFEEWYSGDDIEAEEKEAAAESRLDEQVQNQQQQFLQEQPQLPVGSAKNAAEAKNSSVAANGSGSGGTKGGGDGGGDGTASQHSTVYTEFDEEDVENDARSTASGKISKSSKEGDARGGRGGERAAGPEGKSGPNSPNRALPKGKSIRGKHLRINDEEEKQERGGGGGVIASPSRAVLSPSRGSSSPLRRSKSRSRDPVPYSRMSMFNKLLDDVEVPDVPMAIERYGTMKSISLEDTLQNEQQQTNREEEKMGGEAGE